MLVVSRFRIAKPAGQTLQHCSCCTGFQRAGHMFRDLIPLLADSFHLVAPDLPGFGQSDLPPREKFKYTFENLAETIDLFHRQ